MKVLRKKLKDIIELVWFRNHQLEQLKNACQDIMSFGMLSLGIKEDKKRFLDSMKL